MGWVVTIGQGGSIRAQDRVVDVRVTEEFAHKEFVVTVQKPTQAERDQAKGRINNAIIQIKRGSDIYIEGFIEDVELGQDIVKYSGRSFLVLLGYTTSSKSSGAGVYEAEYDGDTGVTIINDLINTFCVPHDAEIAYTDITFTETYGGEVKLHGKKVYDIVRNMCIDYSKDLWADATWNVDGINVDNKNIHVGTKSRGSSGTPHKTLYGGQHLKNIPTVKYRSSQNVINRIRVNGKGSGKEKISIVVDDVTSQTTYGVIEGSPYNNNMIVDEVTAEAVGQAIIDAKKDLVEEVHVDLVIYISDLKYGDWVRILDSYSGVDTTQRIKKITRSYNAQQGESVGIEIGMPFDNYEMLIKDLTKGDVDEEPEMSKQGGALRLTANDPPGNWIRHDPGQWYDTTGAFQKKSKGAVPFWTGADNPATGTYKKALIQISNAGSVTYKVGTQETTAGAAEGTTVSADALNTPLGEVILKGKSGSVGNYVVEDVYSSDDAGKSYIYRDVRPIVGSSSTGIGGSSPWEVSGSYSQLITARAIDMQGYEITNLADLKGSLNADFSLHGSNSTDDALVEFLQWDHSSEQIVVNRNIDLYDASTISPRLKFRVPLSEGYTGFYVDYHSVDGLLRFRDATAGTSVMTLSDAGKLNLWDDLWLVKGKEINFGSPNTAYIYQDAATNDLKFYDTVLGATKTLSELVSGVEGLWEIDGTETQLITADDIDMQAYGFIGISSLKPSHVSGTTIFDVNGNLRGYLGTTSYAFDADADINMGSSWKLKNLAAGAVNGDSIRYDEFHAHDIATTGTHGVGANTIEHTGHKGAASGYCGLDVDGYIPSVGILAPLTKGNLMVGSATVVTALGAGTNTHVLTVDSTEALGMKWAANVSGIWEVSGIYAQLIAAKAVDMQTNDIVKCSQISGQTTGTNGADKLIVDFRGDNNHQIYYTGTTDNRLGYKTYYAHAFAIQAATIAQIDQYGLIMQTGKYIKSSSGDLELRAPSGSKIKFVIG